MPMLRNGRVAEGKLGRAVNFSSARSNSACSALPRELRL